MPSSSFAFKSAPKLVVPAFSISLEGTSFFVEALDLETFFSSFGLGPDLFSSPSLLDGFGFSVNCLTPNDILSFATSIATIRD